MTKKNNLQYFFILGFQKSGTSTIYEWLNQVSTIKLPINKETHYFSNSNYYNYGLTWYLKQFNNISNPTHLGEIDPSYILNEKYLHRIKSFCNKKTKFIFILRQPFERAYSHYLMSKFRGYEHLSFKDAIKLESNRLKNDESKFSFLNHSYLSRSDYPKYLNSFMNVFPEHDVLFLKMNDFYVTDKKNKMIDSIFSFLNIEYDSRLINTDIKANYAVNPKSIIFQKLLYKDYFLKNIFKSILPTKFTSNVKGILVRLNKQRIIDDKSKDCIKDLLNEEYIIWNNNIILETEKITGLSLSDWKY